MNDKLKILVDSNILIQSGDFRFNVFQDLLCFGSIVITNHVASEIYRWPPKSLDLYLKYKHNFIFQNIDEYNSFDEYAIHLKNKRGVAVCTMDGRLMNALVKSNLIVLTVSRNSKLIIYKTQTVHSDYFTFLR
jgi:rRNA-processing protein FCF1